jgi:hypothetical protein
MGSERNHIMYRRLSSSLVGIIKQMVQIGQQLRPFGVSPNASPPS